MLRLDEQLLTAKQSADAIDKTLTEGEDYSRLEFIAKELNYLVKGMPYNAVMRHETTALCFALQDLGDAYGRALEASQAVKARFANEGEGEF